MNVQFAVAKVSKYASRESGDTLEMAERQHGGISLVLADGQRSGKSDQISIPRFGCSYHVYAPG